MPIEGTPRSPHSVPGGHIRRNLPGPSTTAKTRHCHSSYRQRRTAVFSLPLDEASDHVICGLRLLAQPSTCHLASPQRYSCGYQPGSCCSTPCVPTCHLSSHRWNPDEWWAHLVLTVRRLFDRVLHFQLSQVLAHRPIDLRSSRELFSWDAALLQGICLNEGFVNRQPVSAYQCNRQASLEFLLQLA